jgi:hypothetical protein
VLYLRFVFSRIEGAVVKRIPNNFIGVVRRVSGRLSALALLFFSLAGQTVFANDFGDTKEDVSKDALPSILMAETAKTIRYDQRPTHVWFAFPIGPVPRTPIDLDVRFKYFRNADATRFRVVAEGVCRAQLTVSSPYLLEATYENGCVYTAILSQTSPRTLGSIDAELALSVPVYPGFTPFTSPVYVRVSSDDSVYAFSTVCDAELTSPVYLASIDAPYFDNVYSQRFSEMTAATQLGYTYRGVAFRMPHAPLFFTGGSLLTSAWGRYFLGPPWTTHFYTHIASEANNVIGLGAVYEDIEGHVYTQNQWGTVPLMRLNKWNPSTWELTHAYVTTEQARQTLLQQGYSFDGVKGYVCP